MSLFLKIFVIISYSWLSSSRLLLNQSPNYDNFFFCENSSLIESYLKNYLNIDVTLDNLGFSPNFKYDIATYFFKFWGETNFIPSSYLFNQNFSNCFIDIINNLDIKKENLIRRLIESSGKYLNDLGNEPYCVDNENDINNTNDNNDSKNNDNNDREYFLIQGYFESVNNLTNNEDIILLEFLNQNYFSMGFCLPKNCANLTEQILNEKTFLDFLFYNLKVSNLTIFKHNETLHNYQQKFNKIPIIESSLLAIFIIKFLIGLLRTIFLTKGYERYYIDKKEEQNNKPNISLISIDSNKEEKDSDKKEEEENEQKENKNIKQNLLKENEDIRKESNKSLANRINENNNDIKNIYADYIYGFSTKYEINLYNPFYDNQDKYPLLIKIIKYLDLFDNIKILTTIANKYYNSCNIKKIYFLKFISMFMAIILNVMIGQIKNPSKTFLNYHFYERTWFFLIKICIFSSIFWIILDAVTAGFKSMSYIKKKLGSSVSYNLTFLSLFKIFLLLIPKIFLFIICFFLLHIFSNHLTFELTEKNHIAPFILYDNIAHNYTYSIKDSSKNASNSFKYLFPIYVNYLDYFLDNEKTPKIVRHGDNNTYNKGVPNYTYYEIDITGHKIPSPFLTNTELFINIYLNEFVLFIFMIMITYISYKLKKKLFDYIILAINIILYIIPIFNWTKFEISEYNEEKCEHKYTLIYVLGQYFSEKYTHYFINFYYFGFIIGVMMFYYNENMNSNFYNPNKSNITKSNNSSSSYNSSSDGLLTPNSSSNNLLDLLPFSFCNDIIMYLYKLKFCIKRMIVLICLAFMLLISFSFYIIQQNINKSKNSLCDCLNRPIIKYIFLYEKNACGIFFFIFLLMFIVYPPDKNLVKFSKLNFFILFDRINFSFYCTYSYLIYAAFCVFYIEFKITYINVFLNSLGLFIFVVFINLFVVSSFELPLRMIIKSQMNKNVDIEFRTSFDNGGLISQSNRNTILK